MSQPNCEIKRMSGKKIRVIGLLEIFWDDFEKKKKIGKFWIFKKNRKNVSKIFLFDFFHIVFGIENVLQDQGCPAHVKSDA